MKVPVGDVVVVAKMDSTLDPGCEGSRSSELSEFWQIACTGDRVDDLLSSTGHMHVHSWSGARIHEVNDEVEVRSAVLKSSWDKRHVSTEFVTGVLLGDGDAPIGRLSGTDSRPVGLTSKAQSIKQQDQSTKANPELPLRNLRHILRGDSHDFLGVKIRLFSGVLTLIGCGLAAFAGWFGLALLVDGLSGRRRFFGFGVVASCGAGALSVWGTAVYQDPLRLWFGAGPFLRGFLALAGANTGS